MIGPVSAQGGLLSHGMSWLSVIIGGNLTPGFSPANPAVVDDRDTLHSRRRVFKRRVP